MVETTETLRPGAAAPRRAVVKSPSPEKMTRMVDRLGLLHRIDGKLDVHIALDLAAAERVGEFLGGLGDDLVAVVVEPVDQRADRGIFLVLDEGRVIIRAQQIAAFFWKAFSSFR
jgi:hypothetical protein